MTATATVPALENVLYEKKGSLAYVTVNRPKVLNALNSATFAELKAVFQDAQNDDAVYGVILTGAGEKAFVAGADLGEMAHITPVQAVENTRFGQGVTELIENLGKPVVAAVNGYALGGGCELAMASTIRVAAENAKFGLPEVTRGLIPGAGGTQRMPRLIGKGLALQLILTGGIINAQEAYRIGLVNEVVPAAGLISRAEAILAQINANAPLSIKAALEAVNKGMETSQTEGVLLEATLFALSASTEDKQEGVTAFLEKRAPQFKGR